MSRGQLASRATAVLLVGGSALLVGNGAPAGTDPVGDRAATAAFEEAFTERERIRLQEPPRQPVGTISGVAFGPRGRLAVADRQSDRVFVFDGRGSFRATVGRPGEGPGEYRDPTDVAFDGDGRLYVSDAGSPRIVRYGSDLAPDTVLRLEEAYYTLELERTGGNILAYVTAPELGTPLLRLFRPDGTRVERFHPSHPAYVETPYWSAATDRIMAASPERIVAGGNLVYPLVLYRSDGTFVDSMGHPPASWRQAPRPERGAFAGPDRFRKFARWRRTFTTMQNVALVADRYLVVSHEHLDPEVLAYEDAEYLADVYDLRTGRKRWTDVPLPGPLLIGGEHVTLLVERPPRGWVLGSYEVAG